MLVVCFISLVIYLFIYYMLFSIIYLFVYFFIYAFIIYLCFTHLCVYVFILRTQKKCSFETKKVLFSNWGQLYPAISKLPFLVTTCSRASTPIRTCGIKVLSSAVRTSALRTTNHSRPAQALFPWAGPPGKLGKPLLNHRQLPWTCWRKKSERNKLLAIWWIFWKNHMWTKMNEMIFGYFWIVQLPAKQSRWSDSPVVLVGPCGSYGFLWLLWIFSCLFYELSYPAAGSVVNQVAFLHLRPIEDTQHAQDLGTTFDLKHS